MRKDDVVSCFARLVAFFAGFPPTECWRSFSAFERDCNVLVELLGELEDEAKPVLEERERARR